MVEAVAVVTAAVAEVEVVVQAVAAVVAEVCWLGAGRSQVHLDSGETYLLWYLCSLGMRKHPS